MKRWRIVYMATASIMTEYYLRADNEWKAVIEFCKVKGNDKVQRIINVELAYEQ